MKLVLIAAICLGLLILGLYINSVRYSRAIESQYPPLGDFVDVDGVPQHVIRFGDAGPLVVMLHGASANAREFTHTLAPHLANTHRVLLVDRPGHGYSERPKNAHTLAIQAKQVSGILDILAPNEQAILVGHSFGGAVALRTALDFPGQVAGLVLLAPVTHDWGGGGEAWYNRYAKNGVIGPLFSQLPSLIGPKQVAQSIHKVFDPAPAPASYYEDAAIGLLFRPREFRANAEDVSALRGELAGQQGRYVDLSLPIVVYSGAGDTVLSPQLHVGRLKHQVAGLELVKLQDDGHMPHHAYATDIAAKITELTGHTTVSSGENMR